MELKELIKNHEGLRLNLYTCTAGKISVGYGRNLTDRGISQREAETLLDTDIALAKQDLYDVLDSKVIDSLSDNRYMALVDMMFNLGKTRFRGFKKMIKAIKEGDWDEASRQALDSKWADQVKSRATRDATLIKDG